ncbi:Gtr1/RagA G protein conserved region-domain-containing protein [Geopyxis carbonaria]|nr:Gtr1/RagA G protein conserved region-domain-containing protein [Geopyxis carbonaria]
MDAPPSKGRKKKVLLMGKSGSGKSSMRSIVFSNYVAKDTRRLGATIDVEHSHVRFLGNLTLNLWDCGGQDAFMENYLATQRDHIFRSVEVLIYVFDIESREFARDLLTYSSIIDALVENSPEARVFCLVHKMDLVQAELRGRLFEERAAALTSKSRGMCVTPFATSIWDETLYRAWARIVYTLIPNLPALEAHLARFAELAEAEEVVLFERTTFLVISHVTRSRRPHPVPDRFEKISNIVKQFKQSCTKMASNFCAFELRAMGFAAYIDVLTPNTYILVVMGPGDGRGGESATTLGNIAVARRHFEKLERESGSVVPREGGAVKRGG